MWDGETKKIREGENVETRLALLEVRRIQVSLGSSVPLFQLTPNKTLAYTLEDRRNRRNKVEEEPEDTNKKNAFPSLYRVVSPLRWLKGNEEIIQTNKNWRSYSGEQQTEGSIDTAFSFLYACNVYKGQSWSTR